MRKLVEAQIQVAKWGSGLGVRIPCHIATRAGLTEGEQLAIEFTRYGRIVISRVRPHFTLEELLIGMKPSRQHALENFNAHAKAEPLEEIPRVTAKRGKR